MIRTNLAMTAVLLPGLAATQGVPAAIDFTKHKGVVIFELDGRKIRLEELAKYLDSHYAPGLIERWSTPEGGRVLNSPDLPKLVSQFADLLCLRAEAKAKGIETSALEREVDARLESGFAAYKKKIEKAAGGTDLTEHATAFHKRRYRREQGMRAETAALLDYLVPPRYTRAQLREWHAAHGDVFGGKVRFAHILLSLRDPRTGRLVSPDERKRRGNLAHEIRGRVEKDGSNFGELARKFSDDSATAGRGGEFQAWTPRFNPRLPSALVRAAWQLADGAVSQPVESYYGIHLVRRIKSTVTHYILFYGKTIDRITRMRSRDEQEGWMIEMRKRHAIDLKL